MSTATQIEFGKDSWQTPRNARTLRAYMALQNQEIAGRIRELRGRRPQTVVADALGVAERTYQNWEAGDAKPNYRSLQKLAEYYGVGEDFILAGHGNGEALPIAPVKSDTPDVFVGGVEGRLDRIEQRLDTDRANIAEVKALIQAQNELLATQERILEEIRDATAKQQDAARRLERMTQEAVDAMPTRPARRVPRKAPTGTPTGS